MAEARFHPGCGAHRLLSSVAAWLTLTRLRVAPLGAPQALSQAPRNHVSAVSSLPLQTEAALSSLGSQVLVSVPGRRAESWPRKAVEAQDRRAQPPAAGSAFSKVPGDACTSSSRSRGPRG